MTNWQQAKSVASSGVFHASFDFIVCNRIREKEKNISHLIAAFVTSLTPKARDAVTHIERPSGVLYS